MKGIFIIGAIAVLTSLVYLSTSGVENTEMVKFDSFISKFSRNYETIKEYEFRERIFLQNLEYIKTFNSKGKTWTLGVNKFADMTKEEVKNHFGLNPVTSGNQESLGTITSPEDLSANDDEIDWVSTGYVRPMRNQGSCGSCWAFAANEGVETAFKIYSELHLGKSDTSFPSLSEQLLVDCDEYSAGCAGGFMDNAYYYYVNNNPTHETDYPYTAKDETCKEEGKSHATPKLLGWYDIERFDDDALRAALNLGVVPVAIEAENKDFYLYEGGIISGSGCGFRLDHGVGLVKFHHEANSNNEVVPLWTIKNSWGLDWGEGGFARIQREDIIVKDPTGEYNVGVCGINMQNSIPTYFPR